MNKAFTKESDQDDDDEPDRPDVVSENTKNYVTPFGFAAMQNEMRDLASNERPKLVVTIRWAASNGDRSENGDYIYGKKRLREIDRRVRYLTKRLQNAEIVDPQKQQHLTKVFFGATVVYAEADGVEKTVKLVGIDEADITKNKISWISPLAKALLKSQVGDTVTLKSPKGAEALTILCIKYEII